MRATIAALALLAAAGPASAATFNIGAFAGGIPIIDVSGPIAEHDDERFALFAKLLQFAVVRLDSRGGQIGPALVMGLTIHDKGFSTYVSPGRICASACGLIWLAGFPHAKDETAMVGFHGAFLPVDGQYQQTAPANAAVGAYLDRLHIDIPAIVYMTTPLPNQMAWLTPDMGRKYGIDYDTRGEVETTLWDKPAVVAAVTSPTPTTAVAPLATPTPPMQLQTTVPLVNPAPLPAPAKPARRPRVPPKMAERPRTLQDDITEFFFGPPGAERRPVAHRTPDPAAGAAAPDE